MVVILYRVNTYCCLVYYALQVAIFANKEENNNIEFKPLRHRKNGLFKHLFYFMCQLNQMRRKCMLFCCGFRLKR